MFSWSPKLFTVPSIEKAKDKNDPFRLMGFGHRVYRNFDPRARILKSKADMVSLQSLSVEYILGERDGHVISTVL